MSAESLMTAVAKVDVIDVAGRIIGNPTRNAVAASAAEVVALALATEKMWAIALEADLLVRALSLPETGNAGAMATKDHAVQTQADVVRSLMAELRGDINTDKHERENGHDAG